MGMIKNWEEFALGPRDTRNEMHVTLNDKGEIMIGAAAARRFGPHDRAVLLYDRWNGLVGVAPADPRAENSFPIVSKSNGRHRVIRAADFFAITRYSCRAPPHAKPRSTRKAYWCSI